MSLSLKLFKLVPEAGLEPALLSEPDFESGTSTNFITRALNFNIVIILLIASTVQLFFNFLLLYFIWWTGLDSNQRTQRGRIYSPLPLTTRPPIQQQKRLY